MSRVLSHRGPDGEGVFLDNTDTYTTGLAHRRLSVIDLTETGEQPMHFENLCITYNGEIYNYAEIKVALINLGHTFRGNSDTEVILQAYSRWGKDCVNRFIGMFSFAIYDVSKNELVLVRDRAGVKPLYYYYSDKLFLFASELKAFHEHPSFQKQINMHALAAFMQLGNVPSPHCIFEGCYKLESGHVLILHTDSGKKESYCYWSVYTNAYNLPKLDVSFNEAKKKTEEILISSFNYRMVSDVPVGVFLSGGYDSACVTALLQQSREKKIQTFTIGVNDPDLDESQQANKIARYIGTDHHTIMCSLEEAIAIIRELPVYYDEPFADSSAIPTTLVSRAARQHVTVALSGDGGDEIFAGYNRYDYVMKHGDFLSKLPASARNAAAYLMNKIPVEKIPVFSKNYNFHNRYNKLRMLLVDPSPENLMMSISIQFTNEELQRLFLTNVKMPETAYHSQELSGLTYSPLAYMMAIDYQTYMQDDILQKVDRASMSASLEAREPFLDHRIIEYVARLPDHYKYNRGIKKYLLKEIVHQYVPQDLMNQPKKGFAVPIAKWLHQDLKKTVFHYLDTQKISKQGVFNIAEIGRLKNEFYNGRSEYAIKIWYVLMFQMWYEKWMEE
jgi:asparagine synthase (glutamine-hydrolysing)